MKLPKIPYWPLLAGPAVSFGVGFLLNAIVKAANLGKMPVLMPGGVCSSLDFAGDDIHSCMTSATHLKFLADWVSVGTIAIASPGDFLILLGSYTVYAALLTWAVLMIKDCNS